MSYIPDDAHNIIIDLDVDDYVVPDSYNVVIDLGDEGVKTQYLNATSFDASVLGLSLVKGSRTSLFPQGFSALTVGQLLANNQRLFLKPTGFSASSFGYLSIKSLRVYLSPQGFNAYKPSANHKIEFKQKTINVSGFTSNTFGLDTFIDYAIRYRSTNGFDASRFGLQWIEHNPRFLAPMGIFEQYNAEHRVSPKIIVGVQGFIATRWGSRIIPEIQVIYAQGMKGDFGQTKAENNKQDIFAKGFLTSGALPEYRWGRASAYNLKQYIKPIPNIGDGLHPQGFGAYTGIINVNRTIKTHGHASQRFGFQFAYNNARVITPVGIHSHIEVNATKTLVAYGRRYLMPATINPPLMQRWAAVLNKAKLINAIGINGCEFGALAVTTNRRNIKLSSAGDFSTYGKPSISYLTRSIACNYFYPIAPPIINPPKIVNSKTILDLVGFNNSVVGWLEIITRFNKISPKFEYKHNIGEPAIVNKNKVTKVFGLNSSEFGIANIQLLKRYVFGFGENNALFGRHKIGDAKQTINVNGINSGVLGQSGYIYAIGTGHIPAVRILTSGFDTKNFEDDLGKLHRVGQSVIYVKNENPFTLFGAATVSANTIRVEPGYWELLFGTPKIEHKNRRVYVAPWTEVYQPSKPSLSPHTIYATEYPPEQAIKNHVEPLLPLHAIGGLDSKGFHVPTGVVLGTPSISNKLQLLRPIGFLSSLYGALVARENVLILKPKSWNSLKIGMIAPIGSQKIGFRTSIDSSQYGEPNLSIAEPFHRKISPPSIAMTSIGVPDIQLFHRSIGAVGFDSLNIGKSKYGDNPYLWQGLRIGAFIPTSIGAGECSAFGLAFASNKVRGLEPVGFDSALLEYDYSNFGAKMVVRLSTNDAPQKQIIGTIGVDSAEVAVTNIKNHTHYIRPDGNAEQYRKGAW